MSEISAPSVLPGNERLRVWSDLALLGLGSMEMIWLAMWYQAAFQYETPLSWGAVWGVFFSIILVSYLLTRGLQAGKLKWRAKQGIFLGWILLAGFVSLKLVVFSLEPVSLGSLLVSPVRALTVSGSSGLPFIQLLTTVLLVLRGVALSHDVPGSRGALADFQLGLIALLIFGITYLPSNPDMSIAGLALYLFNGLLVMGATRISGVSNFRGGRLPKLGVPWLAGVLLAALALIGLGLLAGWFSSTQVVHFLVNVVLGLVGLLGMVAVVVFLPVFVAIIQAIGYIFQVLAGLFDGEMFKQLSQLAEQTTEFAAGLIERLEQVSNVARVVIPLVVLGAVILGTLLWLRLRELRLNLRGEEDEAGLGMGSLRGMFKALFRRPSGGRISSARRWLAAERVRRIYAELLHLSERLGVPRKAALTPLEFLPQLVGL